MRATERGLGIDSLDGKTTDQTIQFGDRLVLWVCAWVRSQVISDGAADGEVTHSSDAKRHSLLRRTAPCASPDQVSLEEPIGSERHRVNTEGRCAFVLAAAPDLCTHRKVLCWQPPWSARGFHLPLRSWNGPLRRGPLLMPTCVRRFTAPRE